MKHGHAVKYTRSPTYRSWAAMIRRCTNPNQQNYKYYGGSGVQICERWLKFENFLADVGERPNGLTLDRFPNANGNYEPGNVRWANHKEQTQNQKSNRLLMVDGEKLCLAEAARRKRLKENTLRNRLLRDHWPLDKALNTPLRGT